MMNTGSEPVEVNLLPGAEPLRYVWGQDFTATAEQTVLTEDFSSMAVTINAGETKKRGAFIPDSCGGDCG